VGLGRLCAKAGIRVEIEAVAEGEFHVRLTSPRISAEYSVTLQPEYYRQLTKGKIEPQELVKRSFEFLLQREPPESILSSFDLREIERYFSDYREAIERGL
jgi:hypothetical protein